MHRLVCLLLGLSWTEQGQQFLAAVRQSGKFPGANLGRMQAVLGYP